MGMRLLRNYEEPEEESAEEDEAAEKAERETEIEIEVTAQDVAEKFERLFLRAAQELRKSKELTHLLNCHLEWESEVGWRSLDIRQGRFQIQSILEKKEYPWQGLTIADYDRMSIVLSEISRKPHVIHRLATLPEYSDSGAPANPEHPQNQP
jgi:DNA polymerase-3 subunit epsilon